MAQITFTVNGQVQLSRNLRVLATQISNLRDFFQEACEIVSDRTDQIFEKKGSNVEKGPKWRPLAASTQKARQRGWGYYKRTPNNPTVLRWTGRMQESKAITVNDKSGTLFFRDPKAIYHQEGSSRLPKRPIIDLDNATNVKIVKSLQVKIENDIGIFNNQV